jgi:hypothetical protein
MTVRNHLLATESLVIRGLVAPLVERLGDYLRNEHRHFLPVMNAEVRDLATGNVTSAESLRVGVDAILWAHEFVALTGDDFRRRHHEAIDERSVVVTLDRPEGLTIAGSQAVSWAQDARFFVVRRPKAEGRSEVAARHAEIIATLPYLLVRRGAVALIG